MQWIPGGPDSLPRSEKWWHATKNLTDSDNDTNVVVGEEGVVDGETRVSTDRGFREAIEGRVHVGRIPNVVAQGPGLLESKGKYSMPQGRRV